MRRATERDLPRIVALGRRHHGEVGEPVAFDGPSFEACARHVMNVGAVFMAGEGSIGAVLVPQMYARAHMLAVEMWWNSFDGRGGELLAAVEAWGRDVGAREVIVSATARHKPAAMRRLMARRGYDPATEMWRKELA